MTHQQQENGNGKSVMKLTVPLPVFAGMFITGITIALAVYAKLDCIQSSIKEIERNMVVQDDFAWYTAKVASLNPGHPIPDMPAYFREKRSHVDSSSIGIIQ
jgi:hypothetical protein